MQNPVRVALEIKGQGIDPAAEVTRILARLDAARTAVADPSAPPPRPISNRDGGLDSVIFPGPPPLVHSQRRTDFDNKKIVSLAMTDDAPAVVVMDGMLGRLSDSRHPAYPSADAPAEAALAAIGIAMECLRHAHAPMSPAEADQLRLAVVAIGMERAETHPPDSQAKLVYGDSTEFIILDSPLLDACHPGDHPAGLPHAFRLELSRPAGSRGTTATLRKWSASVDPDEISPVELLRAHAALAALRPHAGTAA